MKIVIFIIINLIKLYYIVFYGFGGFSLSILLYAIIYFTILQKNYRPIKIAETTTFIIHAVSHLITIIINPGIPNRKYFSKFFNGNNNSNLNLYECKKCNIITPTSLNASHCYICGICVLNHDHHAFWMGKCIGKNNLFTFYISIFFISIYFVMSILSLMTYIIFVNEENIKIKKLNK